MHHETRKIFIRNPSYDTTLDTVREKFKAFGKICYIHQFPSGKNWGFVVYAAPAEAVLAAESTQRDDSDVGELERRRVARHQPEFKAKLFWLRRPCNGTAFFDISPAYMSECVRLRSFRVGDNLVTIKVSRKRPEDSLFLSGVPSDITEDLLRRCLLHALGVGENAEGIIDTVKILRNKVDKTEKTELASLQEGLKNKFLSKLKMSNVDVIVWPPREETVWFSAEARFSDPIEGFNACRHWKGRLTVSGVPLDIEPIVVTTLRIQRNVYEACEEDLNKLLAGKLKNIDIEIKKEDKSENRTVRLKGDEMSSIVKARTFISDVTKGDILECSHAPALAHLLMPGGRQMLREAEGTTKAYVCVDNRIRTITIHGSSKAITEMRIRINDYLDQVVNGTVEEVNLRGGDRPPGLLKALVKTYNDDLDILRQQVALMAITINYRWHKLKLTGPPEGIEKAKKVVEELSAALLESCQRRDVEAEEEVDCVTCFCPIDNKDLYRLEACAHPYCKECLRTQVSVAIKDHHLPVVCCQDGCNVPMAWRDFNRLARLGDIQLPALASSALSAYVQANRDKVSFCRTPNCPMVYRLDDEENARTFQCPECAVRVCTACGDQAHDGVTCAMLRSAKNEESGVDVWVSKDPKRRKACPGCRAPLKKTEGCNKMVCGACRTVFAGCASRDFPTLQNATAI